MSLYVYRLFIPDKCLSGLILLKVKHCFHLSFQDHLILPSSFSPFHTFSLILKSLGRVPYGKCNGFSFISVQGLTILFPDTQKHITTLTLFYQKNEQSTFKKTLILTCVIYAPLMCH